MIIVSIISTQKLTVGLNMPQANVMAACYILRGAKHNSINKTQIKCQPANVNLLVSIKLDQILCI